MRVGNSLKIKLKQLNNDWKKKNIYNLLITLRDNHWFTMINKTKNHPARLLVVLAIDECPVVPRSKLKTVVIIFPARNHLKSDRTFIYFVWFSHFSRSQATPGCLVPGIFTSTTVVMILTAPFRTRACPFISQSCASRSVYPSIYLFLCIRI